MPMTAIEAAKRGTATTTTAKAGAGAQVTRTASGSPQSSKQVAVPTKK